MNASPFYRFFGIDLAGIPCYTLSMTKKCHLCPQEATATKIEIELEADENGNEIQIQVRKPICEECAEAWYDGTEEFPGVLPL